MLVDEALLLIDDMAELSLHVQFDQLFRHLGGQVSMVLDHLVHEVFEFFELLVREFEVDVGDRDADFDQILSVH